MVRAPEGAGGSPVRSGKIKFQASKWPAGEPGIETMIEPLSRYIRKQAGYSSISKNGPECMSLNLKGLKKRFQCKNAKNEKIEGHLLNLLKTKGKISDNWSLLQICRDLPQNKGLTGFPLYL